MRTFAFAIVGVLVVVAGIIGLFYVIADSLRANTAALAIVMAVIFLLCVAIAVSGAVLNAIHARNIQPQPRREPIDDVPFAVLPPEYKRPQPQLPPPDDFIAVSDRMSVRQSQIENSATKVFLAMFPHTAPTRSNIKRVFPQMQSDGFISAVQAYLAQRGKASGGGQGREYKWLIDSPTENTDASF